MLSSSFPSVALIFGSISGVRAVSLLETQRFDVSKTLQRHLDKLGSR
jgi:hypothetical protein